MFFFENYRLIIYEYSIPSFQKIMTSVYSNLFSEEDFVYLTQHPNVAEARATLDNRTATHAMVYFSVPITNTIRDDVFNKLGLNLANVYEVPMRWIRGDIAPHTDVGTSGFNNTYLTYLTTNSGEFVVDNASYPILENTAYVFSEGLEHMTTNTGMEPRLLFGPMNDLAEPVGRYPIIYFSNYEDAFNETNAIAYGNSYEIGNIISGDIGATTSWRVGKSYDVILPAGVYNNGFNLSTSFPDIYYFNLYPAASCFLEGTTVLTSMNNTETFIPIEQLRQGDLVKTSRDGYKKVVGIGKSKIGHWVGDERSENRLYQCSVDHYPDLAVPLHITGCHSILVDSLTETQIEDTMSHLGKIYITDGKYRLMACVDDRTDTLKNKENTAMYTIWHLALEHKDTRMNYGIYVNGSENKKGLLVETCSIHMLNKNLDLVN